MEDRNHNGLLAYAIKRREHLVEAINRCNKQNLSMKALQLNTKELIDEVVEIERAITKAEGK